MKNFFHRRFFVNLQSLISLFFLLSIHKTSSSSIYSTPLRMQLTRTHWHHHRLVFFLFSLSLFLRHIFFYNLFNIFFRVFGVSSDEDFHTFLTAEGLCEIFCAFFGNFLWEFSLEILASFFVSEREREKWKKIWGKNALFASKFALDANFQWNYATRWL